MNHADYNKLLDLDKKDQLEKAKYLCYYLLKEYKQTEFSINDICKTFNDFGFSTPNSSRLKTNLIKNKILKVNIKNGKLVIVPITFQQLEEVLGSNWKSTEVIISDSEFLDESLFNSERQVLTKLVKQINCTYAWNCFDATAVLMRRLFEILLILVFKELKEEKKIKISDGTYKTLDAIIIEAKANPILDISRIKFEYDKIQKIGNYSAHRIEYNAVKSDIDNIKILYRTALDELYKKANV